jgi:hypothetical protein
MRTGEEIKNHSQNFPRKRNAKRYFADIIMNFTNHCSKARDYEAQNIEMLICGSFGSFIVIFLFIRRGGGGGYLVDTENLRRGLHY